MIRRLEAGYELDDDPSRIDVDAVHDYLANQSYWAEGRPRETVERQGREATRVVGLYLDGRQVGFARAFRTASRSRISPTSTSSRSIRGAGSASSSCARWSRTGRSRR